MDAYDTNPLYHSRKLRQHQAQTQQRFIRDRVNLLRKEAVAKTSLFFRRFGKPRKSHTEITSLETTTGKVIHNPAEIQKEIWKQWSSIYQGVPCDLPPLPTNQKAPHSYPNLSFEKY